MSVRVSVVIPARNAASHLGDTLDALAVQDVAEPFEVIVVDDGSSDATASVAEGHQLAPRVVRRQGGEGAGAARNAGVAIASASVIAFTDADCVPTPGWLRSGLAAMTDVDLVQGAVRPSASGVAGPWDHTLGVESEYGLYETASLFVRRDLFERVGGFVDLLNDGGRPFGEDADMAWRVRRAGGRTRFSTDALVHHAVIPRTRADYLAERRRDGYFPRLVQRIPELREAFLFHRWFLSPRSAAVDTAVVGVIVAVLRRRPRTLVACLPWLRLVREEARRRAGRDSATVLATVAAGDLVAAWSLLRGSVRSRSPVL
jgi:glycosyltransferase involved in cell wall biosynthesis